MTRALEAPPHPGREGSDAGRRNEASSLAEAIQTKRLISGLFCASANAIPAFARQTDQNCTACHAGGHFTELTPYGWMFKMTGYTIGERTVPISAMVVASLSKVANTSKSGEPGADFQKDGKLTLEPASLLLGGKVTDNLGAFAQVTYDPYATQDANGAFHGHTSADNIDLRYADRFIAGSRDLVLGVSANNNPSVSDPWNTAPAWMQYVPVPSPTSSRFIDGSSPYPGYGAGGPLAGLSAYGFWNRALYLEVGGYGTSRGVSSVFSAGVADADTPKLRGVKPYWRLAYSHEWGAHNLMVGTSGMLARVYDDPLNPADPATTSRFTDLGLDAQYQYLLDPHTVTAQLVYTSNHHRYGVGEPAGGVRRRLGQPAAEHQCGRHDASAAGQAELCVPVQIRRQRKRLQPHQQRQ